MVWSPHTKRNINNLEQVQRRATRFILGRDYSEYERLSKLNLLPLEYRREINDLVFFFKCLKNVCKLNILDYVSFRSCTKPLRNVDHLTLDVPFSRTDVFKNSFFVRICHLWNDLPHLSFCLESTQEASCPSSAVPILEIPPFRDSKF